VGAGPPSDENVEGAEINNLGDRTRPGAASIGNESVYQSFRESVALSASSMRRDQRNGSPTVLPSPSMSKEVT
jgi:hypothetical protein